VHPARAVLGGQLGWLGMWGTGFGGERFASRECLIVSMSGMKSRCFREGFGVKGAGCDLLLGDCVGRGACDLDDGLTRAGRYFFPRQLCSGASPSAPFHKGAYIQT
jgi:hypothetical protein